MKFSGYFHTLSSLFFEKCSTIVERCDQLSVRFQSFPLETMTNFDHGSKEGASREWNNLVAELCVVII